MWEIWAATQSPLCCSLNSANTEIHYIYIYKSQRLKTTRDHLGAVVYILNLSLMSHWGNRGSCQFGFSSGLHSEINSSTHTPVVPGRRIMVYFPPQSESCIPLPRGMDQVSALIAWYLWTHARWQPGLHMHDGALEKRKEGRGVQWFVSAPAYISWSDSWEVQKSFVGHLH